jgi:hypothetical protein
MSVSEIGESENSTNLSNIQKLEIAVFVINKAVLISFGRIALMVRPNARGILVKMVNINLW